MLVFENNQLLTSYIASVSDHKTTVGFVPTMGALHQGHLSLIEQSLKNNTVNIVSIFVNPTQFNNLEDLKKYPRNLDSDLDKIKSVSENIIIYAPTVDDIYEGNTVCEHFDYDGLENQMEGKFRPGHFNGVGTIVKRLFEIVKPNNAYFGEKDFQQLQIVRKMVQKQHLNVNVVCCPIYREKNGLAMSSRNERLSQTERENAKIIYESLCTAKEMFQATKFSLAEIKEKISEIFLKSGGFELEYFEIADEETLKPVIKLDKTKNLRAFVAVLVNNIRLIDTISLK